MNINSINKQVISALFVLSVSGFTQAQEKTVFDIRSDNTTQKASPQAIKADTNNVVKGNIYGLAGNAALTGKDRIGSLGNMSSDYYDYQTGLQIGFPIIKNKLYFFGNEALTEARNPEQYKVGTAETSQILSQADADAISSYLSSRYGDAFKAGTAGDYPLKRHFKSFFNGMEWLVNGRNTLTLSNNMTLSDSQELDRDAQTFRFSSMSYEQSTKKIETELKWDTHFSANLVAHVSAGYTSLHESRDPSGNANMPQVQIAGRTPGTIIYLGTDREASIFDNKQKTWKMKAEMNWKLKEHDLLVGINTELSDIAYTYVSGWNGRIDYLSIEDFLNDNPYRIRGSYNYADNSRDYILNNPSAKFKMNRFKAYLQDKIQAADKLIVTIGLCADKVSLPNKPQRSDKLDDIWTDPNFGTTYSYTPLNRITNDFLNKIDLSPRLDMHYDVAGNNKFILRGGIGMFTGDLPVSWLAYAYRNAGNTYGDFSIRADETKDPFPTGQDSLKPGQNGIGDYVAQTGVVLTNSNSGKTELQLIDNNFEMPKFAKLLLGIDYKVDGWEFSLEGMYQKTIKDIFFQQLNTKDSPHWYGYDTEHKQPVYSGTVDPRFSSIYLMTNTSKGYKYYISASINKKIVNGILIDAHYTYGVSKDIMSGINSSMEANRQLTPSLTPNNPELAYSNSDIRHQITANAGYDIRWKRAGKTNISLVLDAKSGSAFTYGIVNHNIQGNSQYVSLVYIPQRDEAVRFFKNIEGETAQQQADAFNQFIDGDNYLKGRRGQFTERNAGRTPWNVKLDLCVSHEIITNKNKMQSLTISANVINLTNLLSENWGKQYFVSKTFNSTASVGLVPEFPLSQQNKDNYPVYTFNNPGKAYSVDYFASRVRLQVGLKYNF